MTGQQSGCHFQINLEEVFHHQNGWECQPFIVVFSFSLIYTAKSGSTHGNGRMTNRNKGELQKKKCSCRENNNITWICGGCFNLYLETGN